MIDKLNFSDRSCFETFVDKYLTLRDLKNFYAFRFLVHGKKFIPPLERGERLMSSSAFLSNGTIFEPKWSSNGGLETVVSK